MAENQINIEDEQEVEMNDDEEHENDEVEDNQSMVNQTEQSINVPEEKKEDSEMISIRSPIKNKISAKKEMEIAK